MQNKHPRFSDLALDYIAKGYSVIPIKPNSKAPYIKWSEYQKRLPTPEEINKWAAQYPDAGIAVICGKVSDIIAIDIDDENNEIIKQILNLLPRTKVIKRGLKGCTLFYRYNGEKSEKFKNDEGKCAMEVLSDGNYTVLPPSIHPDTGQPYIWLNEIPFENN